MIDSYLTEPESIIVMTEVLAEELYVREYVHHSEWTEENPTGAAEGRGNWRKMKQGRDKWLKQARPLVEKMVESISQ